MKFDSTLTIDLFTRVNDDIEKRQYQILGAIKQIGSEFQHNRIYPSLAELIELRRILNDILKRIKEMREIFPKRISNIDLGKQEIIYDLVLVDGTHIDQIEELIWWALPRIEKVISDGVAIFEFVDQELHLESVGILPNYRESGYFFIPAVEVSKLQVFRFDVSIFHSSDEKHRALRTRPLLSEPLGPITRSPIELKQELIRKEKELPNPATYSFHTHLDFPFSSTILPVARRKLMAQLFN